MRHSSLPALAVLLLIAAAPAPAHSQSGSIVGRVTDARSAPLAGATVRVDGTRLAASTDDNGRYRIGGVPAGAHSVTVLRLGYAAVRRPVTVVAGQDATADATLQTSAVALDEMVVTGTAGGQEKRAIGNVVSTIRAVEVLQQSAAPDMASLLRARAPGLDVLPITGRVGAGSALSIRGPSSLGLSNNPLIYIDGVRVNNASQQGTSVSGLGGFGTQGANVANRLNDINPDDIESIEIIKGPAAATIYGTEATNGVVQIITKKGGQSGRAEVTMQVTNGTVTFRDVENRVPTNLLRDPGGALVEWNGVKQEADSGRPLFTTGQERHYNAAVSGGRDQLRYYASVGYENDLGVEPNNSLRQLNSHLNIGTAIGTKTDVATSIHFSNLSSHLGTDNGVSALLGAIAGHGLQYPGARGFYPGFPPEIPQDLYDNAVGLYRFTGSATLSNQPVRAFSQRAIVGIDYTGEDARAIEHYAPPELAAFLSAASAGGRMGQTLRRNALITADYSGTLTTQLTSAFGLRSSVGGQFNKLEANATATGGIGFPAPGVELVSAAATSIAPSQSQVINTTIGGYVDEQLSWRDRLYLTGAVRVDNNSAFGEDFEWVTYPKGGLSWVVSDEPFWRWGRFVNTFRLRAAYGESGRQPNAFSALRTFTPVVGPGGTNAITPNSLGNPSLKPERGKEWEFGFEAGAFDNLSFEFTHFSKRTIDAIVQQPVAPSTGFSGSQFANLGRVDSRGFEARVTYDRTIRSNLDWSIGVNLARSSNTIKSNISNVLVGPGQFNIVGYPIMGFFARRPVSADRDPTTNLPINILCDGGPGAAPMACNTAPFVYVGSPTPRTTGSVSNTLRIGKSLSFYVLTDFRRNYKVFNQNETLRCLGLTAPGGLCELNYFPERFDIVYLANFTPNALAVGNIDQHFQDASFVKLREISTTYQLPARFSPGITRASITLAARELHTWTKYRGIDPESSSGPGQTGALAQDQAIVPPLTRFLATVNLTW